MARLARTEIFSADEVAIVHVMNRTVRRCFLLGDDPVTGKNYDHRKQWIDDQLVQQAKYFGIDLLCQAIMSNHFHLVLRSRPEVVAQWDDTEVARRWLMLCPAVRDQHRQPVAPTEFELNQILNNKEKLATIRSRLSDISWWMRLLSQNIAQRANRDDDEVGKFWQSRYRAVRLLDETAVLACAAYVDLNPIRAAIAETIEESDYTSAQKRAQNLTSRKSASQSKGSTSGSSSGSKRVVSKSGCSRHLAPVDLQERTGQRGPNVHKGGSRCSNKGFLPMTSLQYLELLDWTARLTVNGKPGATPKHAPSLLNRLGLNADQWKELVSSFGRLFSVVAGQPEQIDQHRPQATAENPVRRRYHARGEARKLFSTS